MQPRQSAKQGEAARGTWGKTIVNYCEPLIQVKTIVAVKIFLCNICINCLICIWL